MKKLSTKITLVVLCVVVVGMAVLFFITNNNVTKISKNDAEDKLEVAAQLQSSILFEYFSSMEKSVIFIGQNDIWSDYIQQLNGTKDTGMSDEELFAEAESLIQDYQANIYADRLEGVLVTDLATKQLLHSNPDAIGNIVREDPDFAAELMTNVDAVESDSIYTSGLRFTAQGDKLVIADWYPVRDDNGTLIGTVCIGGNIDPLTEMLAAHPVSGMESASYKLIDLTNNVYLMDSAGTGLLGEELSGAMADLAAAVVEEQPEEVQNTTFTEDGTGYIAAYVYIPMYNWLYIIQDTNAEVFAASKSASRTVLIIMIIIGAAIAVAAMIFTTIIMRPLPVISGAIKRFGALDLTIQGEIDPFFKRKDEIGEMANAARDMALALRDSVERLNDCRDDIGDATQTMDGAMHELSDCVTTNAAITEELFAGISNTNQSVTQVEEAVDSVFTSVDEIANKVDESGHVTEGLIDRAREIKENAGESLENGRAKIEQHKQSIDEAVEGLKAIENINSMIDDILSISTQTNLLSLNASIEAARAGEAGKGFAVVAGEISSLAEQSATTAGHIQEIVNASNVSIENVRSCFADIIDYMENDILVKFEEFATVSDEYGEESKEIGDSIRAIIESMHGLKDYMKNIVDSAKAVSAAASENEKAVNEIVERNDSLKDISDKMESVNITSSQNSSNIDGVVKQFVI